MVKLGLPLIRACIELREETNRLSTMASQSSIDEATVVAQFERVREKYRAVRRTLGT